MARTGRPAKAEDTRREIVKHVRYSPEEWAGVQAKLDSAGMTFSEFIRAATSSATVSPVDRDTVEEMRAVRNDLVRIGTNINTIARHGASVTDAATLDRFLKGLRSCEAQARELAAQLDKIQDAL